MKLEGTIVNKLLLAAAILGVLQGALTFIGGLVAAFDMDKDVFPSNHYSWSIFMIQMSHIMV